ncbi:MAG: hypothetical protein ABI459_09080, partial [Deltaproteobacteria bacterium]
AAADQVKAAALLLAVLPRDSLAPHRARIETLAKDASNQFPVWPIIATFAAFGPDSVPRLTDILLNTEDSTLEGHERRLAALHGLCVMGGDASAALPALLQTFDALHLSIDVYDKDDLMLNALVAMGATHDDIDALRAMSRSANPTLERFEAAFQSAKTAPKCLPDYY